MRIIYDDLAEFAEIVIRCNETVEKAKCPWCPFYDRCQVDALGTRHVLCGEIERRTPLMGALRKENNDA